MLAGSELGSETKSLIDRIVKEAEQAAIDAGAKPARPHARATLMKIMGGLGG